MSTVKIKSGDTAIEFTSTLEKNGAAVNLTGANVVMLLKLGDAAGTSHSATIVSAAAGTVRCVPGGSFPTSEGTYKQEWEVTFADNTKLTFPSGEFNNVIILDDLN